MNGACGMHRREEKCIQNFDQKTGREGTTWDIMHRWKVNIRMGLREIG
jgi:hypothetical protein